MHVDAIVGVDEAGDADDVVDACTAIARMFGGISAARPLPAFLAASMPGSSGCCASTREIEHAADQLLRIAHRAGRNVIGRPLDDLQVFDLQLRRQRQVHRRDDDARHRDGVAAAPRLSR